MRITALIVALVSGAVSAQSTILETAAGDARLSTLVKALSASNAIETLRGDGPFTVFAPTNDAFAKIDQAALRDLLRKRNRAQLDNVLAYHVAPGSFRAADVIARSGLNMANGQRLPIAVHGDRVRVGNANVVITDIACSNGVVHVIDTVLMPESRTLPQIANRRFFSTLLAAVEAAGLLDTLTNKGPFTVFAPTNDAFAKLPKQTLESLLKPENRAELARILKFHVVAGRVSAAAAAAAGNAASLAGPQLNFDVVAGRLRVQGATVTRTDVNASNGTVHVIDRVLLPPKPARPKGRLVIGLQFNPPTPALASQFGLDRHKSLVISKVTAGSGAEQAGLQRFDIITSVDGKAATAAVLRRSKARVGYGGTVELEIIRRGQHQRIAVEVGVAE